jgi:hypothetical protein
MDKSKSTSFFCHLDSTAMAEMIVQAKRAVVYAAPGIYTACAKAMVKVGEKLGSEMLTLNLDIDERVVRMGYGDFDAIKTLRAASINVNHSSGLRSGLLIVDDLGFSFTPTALYLEAESIDEKAYNAIRLTKSQVKEALARLSPVAKAIALAQAVTEEEKEQLAAVELEIESQPVGSEQMEQLGKKLLEAPPVNFDVARQVRVFVAYLQYVEISLTGVAIERYKLIIPKELQSIGGSHKEIENRLRTTFNLIDKNGSLSSKGLENDLNCIREALTHSLGKDFGRIILKSAKNLFEKRLSEFENKLNCHAETVRNNLQFHINDSREYIVNYYLPIVKDNPPDELFGSLIGKPTNQDFKSWINRSLDRVFPSADSLIKIMKLEFRYKDITYETLNKNGFIKAVNKVLPKENMKRVHDEFLAAKSSS